jgi:hypothetical protein
MGDVTKPGRPESSGEAIRAAGEAISRGRYDRRRGGEGQVRAGVVLDEHEAHEHGGEQADDRFSAWDSWDLGTGELGESDTRIACGEEEGDEFE